MILRSKRNHHTWFVGAEGENSETTLISDVFYHTAVSFEIVYGVGSLHAAGSISGFGTGAAATIFSGCFVGERIGNRGVIGLKKKKEKFLLSE